MKVARKIVLTEEERTTLNVWLRLPASARLALRAKIILLAADGRTNKEIAAQSQATRKAVSLWRRRFQECRLAGIEKEVPRNKQKPTVDAMVIFRKMEERPANAPRWTIRSLAKELGISSATLHRALKTYGLDSIHKQLSRWHNGLVLFLSWVVASSGDAVFWTSEILS